MNKKGKRTLFHNLCQRWGLASISVCLLVIFLASCAKPTPPPDPVTISFAYPEWYGAYFEPLADEFRESYPYITLELRPVPATVFVQSFWAGDADTFVSGTWFTNLRMMLDQGLIMDLRPFATADTTFDPQDFYLGEGALLTEGRAVRGIPLGTGMTVMYYNQDLLDEYGVDYPEIGWTWADFLEIARALRDPDADVFGYAPTDPAEAASFVYQHGGRLFDDLQTPTYATYDDPLTIEALEWYAALFLEHNVAPTPEQARRAFGGSADYAVFEAIQRGQVGMWMGAFWQQGSLDDEDWGQAFRWGIAPLPREAQAATPSTGDYLFTFEEAQRPEECWLWLSFVSEHVPPDWLVPMRKSQVESEAYTQLLSAEAADIIKASAGDVLIISPAAAGRLDIFGRAVESVITERNTPREAMEWAQQEAEKTFR